MAGKMPRSLGEEAKLSRKICAFLEKKMMYYFYVSTIAGLLKGCPGEISNVSNAFLVNADLLQSSGHFFLS